MTIRVALNHRTIYEYDQSITVHPQIVRLRPAPHCRTPVLSYSLNVTPSDHFVNWQQDPHGNFLARFVFPKKTRRLAFEVDLVADMTVINPFDFFIEEYADYFPFKYEAWLSRELRPFMEMVPSSPAFGAYFDDLYRSTVGDNKPQTTNFLVDVNQRLQQDIRYTVRMEPGVQTPEETLLQRSGSCRDSSWLLVQLLRRFGLAARFVSGYLIQLAPDQKPLDGAAGPVADFTDLHAWTEVYLPGAGWVGLDPTSGLLVGEGHIPLAATPDPSSAAPISGSIESAEASFNFSMSVTRVHEDPRVTKPYSPEQWAAIDRLGESIDERLIAGDVRLTMGGEPTFVSIDDMDGEEWNSSAVGKDKRDISEELIRRLRKRFGAGGLLHYGQGKWYPGESLPRWSFACHWRKDGVPVWKDDALFADTRHAGECDESDAKAFVETLAKQLKVSGDHIIPAFEDVAHFLVAEQRLPVNVDPTDPKLDDPEERARMVRVFERGMNVAAGFVLPLRRQWWQAAPRWESGPWPLRSNCVLLLPGDSPVGLRLPLDSLPHTEQESEDQSFEVDPNAPVSNLPVPLYKRQRSIEKEREETTRQRTAEQSNDSEPDLDVTTPVRRIPEAVASGSLPTIDGPARSPYTNKSGRSSQRTRGWIDDWIAEQQSDAARSHAAEGENHGETTDTKDRGKARDRNITEDVSAEKVIRTALCVETRNGHLHVFMPPLKRIEDYLDLTAAIESTAAQHNVAVVIEGYPPPCDSRVNVLKVTPDPGVIEVNTHPAADWRELVDTTRSLYAEARETRLGAEKFDLDGKHTGTGGGNHIVVGAARPGESPFLWRPDLLKSLLGYWINHPSLSYLFSGRFVGPTSQAPRVDEGRRDALYELEMAFELVPKLGDDCPPWHVDRLFRNLLIDLTGNTHRAEFCIDKLFSPDSSTGRLGLVELRAFEMPPHADMSLAQQLLIRGLIAAFWERPYEEPIEHWGTTLHDRFMLPHFVWDDFGYVIEDLGRRGFAFDKNWFAPHFEFRFPFVGECSQDEIHLELRTAIEPWYVLGEEPSGSSTARFVDSSVERLQVKVSGMAESKYVISCNGRRLPLYTTGTAGQVACGIRYRAWQPESCLHPTIPVHTPLTFDIIDTVAKRSLGGCCYHVSHPAGRNYETFPVNAAEAEARRAARFFAMGHTPGAIDVPFKEVNPTFPLTLDLRRTPKPA